ncbi:methyltransferase domain-containing protein [Thermopolyspora sp. NPDC052614]|uniref:class I SAM-dependent methyltransferase n=1 Tax=Thermopolyspora sp. NPDC052614 TaxID=3155682 RepID=UPI003419E58F
MSDIPADVLIFRYGPDPWPEPVLDALRAHNLAFQECRLYAGESPPPDLDGFRALIVIGDPGRAEERPPGSHLREQAQAAAMPILDVPAGFDGAQAAAFAELAANSPAYRSVRGVRAFFAARAATWEKKFPDDGPVFAAAIAELAPGRGSIVLDAGCGTGRAMPLLRDAVGPDGRVIGIDLTPEMIYSARERGRGAYGPLLIADVARLPLPEAAVDAVFAAGLISHLPDAAAMLTELARVTRPGGRLALFHPVGRAVLAARHGRRLTPGDLRARENLTPLLGRTGWALTACHDEDDRYLALAVRTPA